MKRLHIIPACLLILLLSQATCRKLGAFGLNPKLPSNQLNPYRGAVKDILPPQVGDYKLVQVSPLNQIDADLTNPSDGAGAIYNSSNNHTVQHLLANFH